MKMKKKCQSWWQAVIILLQNNPRTLTMIVYALSLGFVLMAIGAALNLAGSASIIEVLK